MFFTENELSVVVLTMSSSNDSRSEDNLERVIDMQHYL